MLDFEFVLQVIALKKSGSQYNKLANSSVRFVPEEIFSLYLFPYRAKRSVMTVIKSLLI